MATPTPGGIPALDKINQVLAYLPGGIGAVFACVELVRQLFKRKEAGEPEMTLEQMAQFLMDHGASMQEFSNTWLAEHGYDSEGRKIESGAIESGGAPEPDA